MKTVIAVICILLAAGCNYTGSVDKQGVSASIEIVSNQEEE